MKVYLSIVGIDIQATHIVFDHNRALTCSVIDLQKKKKKKKKKKIQRKHFSLIYLFDRIQLANKLQQIRKGLK
jgi:hypothetical protein